MQNKKRRKKNGKCTGKLRKKKCKFIKYSNRKCTQYNCCPNDGKQEMMLRNRENEMKRKSPGREREGDCGT